VSLKDQRIPATAAVAAAVGVVWWTLQAALEELAAVAPEVPVVPELLPRLVPEVQADALPARLVEFQAALEDPAAAGALLGLLAQPVR
jgi:hypothetical protein